VDLAFTLALHRAVDPDPDNDLCWSPFSVLSALGLTAEAAEGTSRDELVGSLLGDPAAEPVEAAEAGAELGRRELGVEEHAACAVERAGQGLARRHRQGGGAEQAERDLLAERAQLVVGAVGERGSGEVEAAGVDGKIGTHCPGDRRGGNVLKRTWRVSVGCRPGG